MREKVSAKLSHPIKLDFRKLSSEHASRARILKASIDGRLIHIRQVRIKEPPSGGFFSTWLVSATSGFGTSRNIAAPWKSIAIRV
jgi:hypothetical protein